MKTFLRTFIFIGAFAIFAAGIFYSYWMIKNKPAAEKKPKSALSPLVQVAELQKDRQRIIISAIGKVIPSRKITLKTRVGGELKNLSPKFIPGSIFKEGEIIAEIDGSDYIIALKKAEASLLKSKANLELEEAQQQVAKKNYTDFIAKGGSAENESLILRKPQMSSVLAELKIAEANLESAKLDLERTKIKAPFNCTLLKILANKGDQLASQSAIAEIAATQNYWIEAAIPKKDFEFLKTENTQENNSNVEIHTQKEILKGEIIQIMNEIDPDGQMIKVVVNVENPFDENNAQRLFLNQLVNLRIFSKNIENCYKIERKYIQEGKILLLTAENKLKTLTLSPIWEDRDWIYTNQNIPEGAKLIISDLPFIIENMELRIAEQKSNQPETID